MDTTYCREPPFNIYYKINYLDKNYLFAGCYHDQFKKIFEKINTGKILSKEDQDLLKKYYGNNFLENTKGYIYIPQFIDQDDTILTIKKKLLIYLDINLDIEDLLIYSKRISIDALEQDSIKLRLLEDFNLFEYQNIKDIFNFVDFKSSLKNTDKLNDKNINNININHITDILGFKYNNITGRKLIGYDANNFKDEYKKGFDDDFIDEEHRTLEYYGELEKTKLSYKNRKNDRKFQIINLYLQTYGEFTGIDEDILSLYFPLKRTGESLRKSRFYNDIINDHDALVNKYHSLSYEKNLEDFPRIYSCNIKNVVMCFNKRYSLSCQDLFDKLTTTTSIPFIYLKQINGHFYKINESLGHKQNTRYIKNYKNFDEYLMNYVSYSDLDITKETLMSWKTNKYTIKERLFLKQFIIKRQNLEEITLKIKIKDGVKNEYIKKQEELEKLEKLIESKQDKKEEIKKVKTKLQDLKNILGLKIDYITITLNSLGFVFIKLLEDVNLKYRTLNIIKNRVIKKINTISKHTGYNLNISNEKSNIHFVSFDSNNMIKIPDSMKFKFSKLESTIKQYYPYVYLTYSKDSNILNIKYKKVDFIETRENYKKYFIKLKQSLKNINASDFRDLWILECKNVFNLNSEEALQELTIITEELNEDELRKSFFQNEVNIEIKRENPDVVNKLDLFSIHFDNLTNISQLLRTVEFINTMMYANTIKPKKTKEEPIVVSEIKLVETKAKTLIDEDEIDFDDDFLDSDDEDEDEEEIVKEEPVLETPPNQPIQEESDEEKEAEFQEDISKMTLRKYMSDNIRKKYDELLHDTTINVEKKKEGDKQRGKFKGYATSCGMSDMRQPMIINQLEYDSFKKRNIEGFNETSMVKYGSSPSNLNYFVCARIWCIKDKLALTPEQFLGELDYYGNPKPKATCFFCQGGVIDLKKKVIGEDNTIIIKRGGSNNYWMDSDTDNPLKNSKDWKTYLNKTEKDPYVGFLDKKNHPLGLCMPCCFSREIKSYGDCLEAEVDVSTKTNLDINQLKPGYKLDNYTLTEGSTILVKNQTNKNENNIYKILNDRAIIHKQLTNLGTPIQNNMEINILNGLQAKYKWIAKEFTKGEFIFTKGEESAQYDEKYIVGKDKIPFKNKHGILPDILENLLKNNINDKIKKGRLNNGEYGFLRKGIEASPNNSFINAMANYHDQSGLWLLEKIIKNLDPLTFVNLNRGDLLKLFSPGIFTLDQKKQQFIKWCKTYPTFTKFMKCESILREDIKQPINKKVKLLINVFYAFENFKIYLSNLNIKKNIDFLWELFSIKTPWLNPKGLNILIIEKIIEEQKEKIKILCPKNGSPQLLYNSTSPIYILLKTGDLYEPIIYTLSDKKDKKYVAINMIKKNLPIDVFEILNDLMSIFVNQCQEELNIELINQFNKIKYDQLPSLTEIKSILSKKGIEIDSQLVNLKLEGIGLLTKDNLIIYTKKFGIKKDINYTYLGDIALLDYQEVIKEYDNLFGKKVTFNVIEKNNTILGLLSNHGSFIPVKNADFKKQSNFKTISLNYNIDDDELHFYEEKKIEQVVNFKDESMIYEYLRDEISFLFKKKNKNLSKIKTALNKVLLNPILTISVKRSKISDLIQPIVNGLVTEGKMEKKTKKVCQESSKKTCKNKCGIDSKNIIEVKLEKETLKIFVNQCKLKITKALLKKYINKIVEEILRYPLKRRELLDRQKNIDTDFKDNKNEVIANESNFNMLVNQMYKQDNFHGDTFNTLNLYPLSEDLKDIVKIKPVVKQPSKKLDVKQDYEKIFATTIAKNGEDLSGNKKFKEGYCLPYNFKSTDSEKKLFNQCIVDKRYPERGSICATSVYTEDDELVKKNKDTIGYPKTWGFCEGKKKATTKKTTVKSGKKITIKKKKKLIPKSECVFPFKYKSVIYNDCIDTGNGAWCPTAINEGTRTMKKWAYCDLQSSVPKLNNEPKLNKNEPKLNNQSKSTKKKSQNVNSKGEKAIKTTKIKRTGKLAKNASVGTCVFPFKYDKVLRNKCVDTGDGPWCAVNVDPKTKTYDKWGYCVLEGNNDFEDLTSLKKTRKKIKIVKAKKSTNNSNTSWIAKFMKDKRFNITPTKTDGDCFFDCIFKALKIKIKEQREVLTKNVDETLFNLFKNLYENAQKENDLEMIDEYDFMDGVDSVDELKKALKKLNFWANSWAISTLEKHYNIKIVIFSKENYSRGARNNILQCGDIPTSIAEPKCKMCKIKLSEYQRTKKKEHPEDHVWVDTNDNKEINPTDYVMVSHTGNHYELITFNGEKSFKNLPDIVKNKIKEKCSKDGELLGAYSKIKDF